MNGFIVLVMIAGLEELWGAVYEFVVGSLEIDDVDVVKNVVSDEVLHEDDDGVFGDEFLDGGYVWWVGDVLEGDVGWFRRGECVFYNVVALGEPEEEYAGFVDFAVCFG